MGFGPTYDIFNKISDDAILESPLIFHHSSWCIKRYEK